MPDADLPSVCLRRDTRKSLIAQTNPNAADWSISSFLVALLVWGPDTQGQLLKAFGLIFRTAASLPMALIHFVNSLEAYSTMFKQVYLKHCFKP